ncbi:uncharacterized protein ColSpa_05195 [Colletotrichum spaethianum]|uniref:Uncharacterized protein n=1 Tax=Colletotrichum spaethianum TaxID=700344 RepID=A0AA37LEK9_9PEZI|nr:uncharacterized protein ColSpa_05195 [Colletotrichum spaethianum]GKT45014.1 hypothetical protein ColSpa_05195 [Colletotrichum spaethianum]
MVASFVVAFPAVFGMAEAIRHTQSQARRKEHRSRKNNILIDAGKLEGKHIVLSDDKVSIYLIHLNTYEIKFGTRPYAQPNLTGPFDCTRQDKRLTFAGWEGFFAVKAGEFWALYFDVEQDGLKSKLGKGVAALEVDLLRVEMPVKPVKQEEKEEQPESKDSGRESKENNTETRGPEVELESPEAD